MKVVSVKLDKCLSTTFYDPSPDRLRAEETPVSQRRLPVIFSCDNCDNTISFSTEDFEKHNKSNYTNLLTDEKILFDDYKKINKLKDPSFLDFYCPKCKQATTIVFNGGPSGYWGAFEFKISRVLIIKPLLKSNSNKFIEKLKRMIASR